MKLSRADLRDKFEAYESEATYTTGNKSTHQMIAMADIDQVLDEIMNKGDIIQIVRESFEGTEHEYEIDELDCDYWKLSLDGEEIMIGLSYEECVEKMEELQNLSSL